MPSVEKLKDIHKRISTPLPDFSRMALLDAHQAQRAWGQTINIAAIDVAMVLPLLIAFVEAYDLEYPPSMEAMEKARKALEEA